MKNGYKFLFPLALVLVFLLDRASKVLVMKGLQFSGEFVSFVVVYNAGAAFGLMQGQRIFLIVFSLLAILIIGYYVLMRYSSFNLCQLLGLGMLCGGTAGNLFDRVGYGYVIDFIKLNFVDFPVFNVADMFINIGVALVVIGLLKKQHQ
jgi:signal peptidase II